MILNFLGKLFKANINVALLQLISAFREIQNFLVYCIYVVRSNLFKPLDSYLTQLDVFVITHCIIYFSAI